ncbi:MAG: acylneuraminate cytidylyltransferase family protein [Parcubacteria group bacterium]|nr:acylneuraminate cytidylyltransferase family protein [Parcubacteria group bacterium]
MSSQQNLKILGVITARGGSKGIPRKNIKELKGQPLIAYTIKTAQESGIFDRIILSTDDAEIAEVAGRYGVETPFMRPAELAQDGTPHLPVLKHAVEWLRDNQNYLPDAVMLLQPTAPLCQSFHIKETLELLKSSGADSVVSMSEIPGHFSPYWAVVEGQDKWAKLLVSSEPLHQRIPRRQSFPQKTYYHNGAVYLFKTELILHPSQPNFYGDRAAIYPMAEKYSINLDSPEDWHLAELALEKLEQEKNNVGP